MSQQTRWAAPLEWRAGWLLASTFTRVHVHTCACTPSPHVFNKVVKAALSILTSLITVEISYHTITLFVVNIKEVRAIPETFSSLVRPLYEPLLSPLKSCPTDKGNFPRSCGQLMEQIPVFLEPYRKCHHVTILENYGSRGDSMILFPAPPHCHNTHLTREQRSFVCGIGKPLALSVDS